MTDELIEQMSAAFRGFQKLGRSEARELARAALQAIEASGYTITKTVSADNYAKGKGTSPPLLSGTVRDDNGGIWNLTVDLRPWKEGNNG